MEQISSFIGVDVSKATLDVCLLESGVSTSVSIKNSVQDVRKYFREFFKDSPKGKVYLCLENTGLYNWTLYKAVESYPVELYVVSPLHLKRSQGLTRGKTDKIDAERIAGFIQRHHHELKPYKVPSLVQRKMSVLMAQRKRLIKMKATLDKSLNELKSVSDKKFYKEVESSNKRILKPLNSEIKKLEKVIQSEVQKSSELNNTYQLVTSVPGVGPILAWNLIVKTQNFTRLTDPRKLGCYAGVVPFQFQSGTSIRKRPAVSHLADKSLKSILHMAAIRAIRLDGELQDYYNRKVEEGKAKMSVINAVRNKILSRVCAVVRNQEPYKNTLILS